MKLLVETTGSFMLKDPSTGDEIDNAHPSVVKRSEFIQSRTAMGQINIISVDLQEEATDAEFQKFWKECKGDKELAVESFLSAWGKAQKPKVEKQEESEVPEAPKAKPAIKAKGKQ